MVTNYQLLIRLEKEGTLKQLIKRGLISTTVLFYLEVYKFYLEQHPKFKKKTESVYRTADHFNISDQSVYRIILKMQ